MVKRVLPLLFAGALCLGGCDSATSIKSVEPSFGNVAGNDDVVLNGSGFKEGTVVQFGKAQVNQVVVESPSRIRVKTPSGAEGKVDVVLIRDDGKTVVLKDGFTYRRDAPTGK